MTTNDQDSSAGAAASRFSIRQRLPDWAFIALTVLALVLCYFIARPFVTSIAWATALAVVCTPLHRQLERRVRWKGLAAACSVSVIALFLIVLAGLMIPRIVAEAYAGFLELRARIESDTWNGTLDRHSWIRPAWGWLEARIDLRDVVERAALFLASAGSLAVRWSLQATIEVVLIFFFLFYFLRDRERLLAGLQSLLPTSHAESTRIFEVAEATIFATAYGAVLIGIVQGFLGGLMFWWLGISAPWFWAIIMGILSIVPLVGAPLVWIPAAVLLLLDGQWQHAIGLAVWGALVVGLADNLLHPIVVARYLRLHTVLLVVSMVGGLFVFGPSGFFVGPVLLAVTMTMLEIWRDRAEAATTANRAHDERNPSK